MLKKQLSTFDQPDEERHIIKMIAAAKPHHTTQYIMLVVKFINSWCVH